MGCLPFVKPAASTLQNMPRHNYLNLLNKGILRREPQTFSTILYLHGSPVIGQEGHCISKIPVMLSSHAVTIVLSFVATSYVVTCHILQIPQHWYLCNDENVDQRRHHRWAIKISIIAQQSEVNWLIHLPDYKVDQPWRSQASEPAEII